MVLQECEYTLCIPSSSSSAESGSLRRASGAQGPPPSTFSFEPKHKSTSYAAGSEAGAALHDQDVQG